MSQNLSSAAVVIGALRVKRPPCQLNCLCLYSNKIYGKDFSSEISSSPHLVLAARSKAVVLLLSINYSLFVVASSVLQSLFSLGFLMFLLCQSWSGKHLNTERRWLFCVQAVVCVFVCIILSWFNNNRIN